MPGIDDETARMKRWWGEEGDNAGCGSEPTSAIDPIDQGSAVVDPSAGLTAARQDRGKVVPQQGPVGLQERDADMAWLGSTQRRSLVPSRTRGEMRIHICAEQVQLGCSKTKCSMSAATRRESEAAMWTSTSRALGLEQERRDQEEMMGAALCRKTARCRCEGPGDVDAERDQCIKARGVGTGGGGTSLGWQQTGGGRGVGQVHGEDTAARGDRTSGSQREGMAAGAGRAHGVEARKRTGMARQEGCGETGRAWWDGTGLAGRQRRQAAGNAGAGFGQGRGGCVELAEEDSGGWAWRCGHGWATRAGKASTSGEEAAAVAVAQKGPRRGSCVESGRGAGAGADGMEQGFRGLAVGRVFPGGADGAGMWGGAFRAGMMGRGSGAALSGRGFVSWQTVGEVWGTGVDGAESQVLMQSWGNLWGKRGKRPKRILASMVSA
ncbi:hypothetical protein B0H14DRAFT_2582156 [Mycena olivaceomarginata]|nr:hypothetical protein B0H14DRAFT_2582156 [Mycena olivaceomarginata]